VDKELNIAELLDRHRLNPDRCLMVGDGLNGQAGEVSSAIQKVFSSLSIPLTRILPRGSQRIASFIRS
jgi:hypothetical protein